MELQALRSPTVAAVTQLLFDRAKIDGLIWGQMAHEWGYSPPVQRCPAGFDARAYAICAMNLQATIGRAFERAPRILAFSFTLEAMGTLPSCTVAPLQADQIEGAMLDEVRAMYIALGGAIIPEAWHPTAKIGTDEWAGSVREAWQALCDRVATVLALAPDYGTAVACGARSGLRH
jgi:hypothetical protein